MAEIHADGAKRLSQTARRERMMGMRLRARETMRLARFNARRVDELSEECAR